MSVEQLIPLCLDGIEVLGQPVWITARPKLHSAFRFFKSLVPNEFPSPCSSRGKGRLGTTERVIVISPGAVKLKHQDVPRDCASRTDSEDPKICLVFLWSLFSNNLASTTTNHLQQVFQLGHRWFEVHFHILASVSRWGKENALPPDDSKPLLSLSLSNPVQDILQAKAHPKQPESWRVEMALFWYHLMRTARSTSICKHHSDRKAAQNRRYHKGSLNHLVLLDIKAHIYDNDQMCTTDLMARHRSKLCTDPVNSSSQPPNKHASPPMLCKRAPCQKGECDHMFIQVQSTYCKPDFVHVSYNNLWIL